MSKQTEALKLALEALEQIDEAMPFPVAKLAQKVIREALAHAPKERERPAKQWVDAGDLKQLKKGDRIRTLYKGSEDMEFTLGGSAPTGAADGTFYWHLAAVSGYMARTLGAGVDEETGAVYADRGWKVEVLK